MRRDLVKRILSGYGGMVIITATCGTPSMARDELNWVSPSGGKFGDRTNWDLHRVPTGGDATVFGLVASYTVQFDASYAVDSSFYRFGEVALDLQGQTLTLLGTGGTNPGLQVGAEPLDDAALHVRNGLLHVQTAGIADIGNTLVNLPRGVLTLAGANAALDVNGDFGIGHSGEGSLLVSDGARVLGETAPTVIGWESRAQGLAVIEGAGSQMNVRDLYVAQDGAGVLLIDAGGRVETTRVVSFGNAANGEGLAVIRGSGSVWQHRREPANSQFLVGERGAGTLGVLDGGILNSDEPVSLTPRGLLFGDGVVHANVESGGVISPGGVFNEQSLQVWHHDAGLLTVEGDLALLAVGSLQMELGGVLSGDEYDVVRATGEIGLGGTLGVTLLAGFQPSLGQTFKLLHGSSISGSFSELDLPLLHDGLTWQAAYLPQAFQLIVVPTPVTAVPLLLGMARPVSRRRNDADEAPA